MSVVRVKKVVYGFIRYPKWEKREQTISQLLTLNKMAGKLKRFVIGNASECEMDGQGRLLLPEKTGTLHGWINIVCWLVS